MSQINGRRFKICNQALMQKKEAIQADEDRKVFATMDSIIREREGYLPVYKKERLNDE